MIRDMIKKLYFRISPVRRSTARMEELLNSELSARLAGLETKTDELDAEMTALKAEMSASLGGVARSQEVWNELFGIAEQKSDAGQTGQRTEQDYIHMQQEHYEDTSRSPEVVVGNYAWHEQFPYETFLLYRNGDVRKPLFASTADKVALDFACGPGRMIKRMQRYFKRVDGCDISPRLIEEAKKRVPEAGLYVTNGNDLGDVPLDHYDFVYCTISMQHIASHHIRMEIIEQMYKALRPGGKITLQLAYNPGFPYVAQRKRMTVNDCEIRVYQKQSMAGWDDDDYGATTTNGGHDVGIGEGDLQRVKEDFSGIFRNVALWFGNVSNYYNDLEGNHHGSYWATDWIFIYGEK